jgi:hypothetical protein
MLTRITKNQKSHRQPLASERYPPAIGPTVGPSIMGRTQIDKIFPRTSCLNMSDMLPGPRVRRTSTDSRHDAEDNYHWKIGRFGAGNIEKDKTKGRDVIYW